MAVWRKFWLNYARGNLEGSHGGALERVGGTAADCRGGRAGRPFMGAGGGPTQRLSRPTGRLCCLRVARAGGHSGGDPRAGPLSRRRPSPRVGLFCAAWRAGSPIAPEHVEGAGNGRPVSEVARGNCGGWTALGLVRTRRLAAQYRVDRCVGQGRFAPREGVGGLDGGGDQRPRRPAAAFASWVRRPEHLVLEAPHPSPLSAHRGFFGSRPFSQANRWLEQHGRPPVDWWRGIPNR